MRVLNILVLGSDEPALQQMAMVLADEGVRVQTSHRLLDSFALSRQEWDFLLIDLDGLNSFMRSLLPTVCGNFRHLPMIGIVRRPGTDINHLETEYGLNLDGYFSEIPRPEDLIVSFPQVTAKYLSETGPLRSPGPQPFFTNFS